MERESTQETRGRRGNHRVSGLDAIALILKKEAAELHLDIFNDMFYRDIVDDDEGVIPGTDEVHEYVDSVCCIDTITVETRSIQNVWINMWVLDRWPRPTFCRTIIDTLNRVLMMAIPKPSSKSITKILKVTRLPFESWQPS